MIPEWLFKEEQEPIRKKIEKYITLKPYNRKLEKILK